MKLWRLCAAGLLALPLMAPAQENDRSGRRPNLVNREGAATRPSWGMRGMNLEAPSDEEWAKTLKFMEANLPNTLEAFNKMNAESPRREGTRRRIYAQYKELTQLQERADTADGTTAEGKTLKARADARLDQAKKGDEILGLVMKWHNAAPKDKAARRQELRDKVKERMSAELKERQAQIETLRARLEDQEKKLKADQEAMDKSLESRVDFFIDHSAQFVNPAPNPRGSGYPHPPAREGVENAGEQQ